MTLLALFYNLFQRTCYSAREVFGSTGGRSMNAMLYLPCFSLQQRKTHHTMLSGLDFVFAGLAALAAGAVNALAGGGTLITFPALTFLGIPAVGANVRNNFGRFPGYFVGGS